MLEIKDLQKSFQKDNGIESHVLKGLNLTIEDGEFVTVLGNNGAGKSTLFNLISGTILPNEGTIDLDHEDITFIAGTQAVKIHRPGVSESDEGNRAPSDRCREYGAGLRTTE